jgi:hypothetical protein
VIARAAILSIVREISALAVAHRRATCFLRHIWWTNIIHRGVHSTAAIARDEANVVLAHETWVAGLVRITGLSLCAHHSVAAHVTNARANKEKKCIPPHVQHYRRWPLNREDQGLIGLNESDANWRCDNARHETHWFFSSLCMLERSVFDRIAKASADGDGARV